MTTNSQNTTLRSPGSAICGVFILHCTWGIRTARYRECIVCPSTIPRWNRSVVIVTIFSLDARKVVKRTTFGATSDENAVKRTTSQFQRSNVYLLGMVLLTLPYMGECHGGCGPIATCLLQRCAHHATPAFCAGKPWVFRSSKCWFGIYGDLI